MTCADVDQLRDAFIDAELPGPMLLAIARHAGACVPGDEALRTLTAMRDAFVQTMQGEAAQLDVSKVWPAVASEMARAERRQALRKRARALPAWGAAAAVAAGIALWFPGASPGPETIRVAARPRPNHTVIERLNVGSHNRVALRRERKNGTTLIMVSANGDEVLR